MKFHRSASSQVTVLLLTLLVLAAPFGVSALTTDAKDQALTPQTFVDLAKKVRPAVVSIKINVETREMIEQWQRERSRPRLRDENEREIPRELENLPDWLREFFDIPEQMRPPFILPHRELFEHPYGAGSGVIFRSDGYILTSRHVVYSPLLDRPMFKEGQITVALHDGREFTGDQVRVVGTDALTDLAVLKIEATGLPSLQFADSDRLEIGEWVMSVGDPLELTGSVSQGIISGMKREIEIAGYPQLLQTTAIINPGNSGGPLVNLNGEIIGVNMAIASETRRWAGVGFTIPSNLARPVAEEFADHGRLVSRGHIGIKMLNEGQFPEIAKRAGYEGEHGVVVDEAFEGLPAAKAGLQPYDIIVEIDGNKAKDIVTVQRLITAHKPGEAIRFKVFRDGKYKDLTVVPGEWPSEKELAALTKTPASEEERDVEVADSGKTPKGRIGLTVEDYPRDSSASEDEKAVVIKQIHPGRPAASAEPSLKVGDVVLEVEKKRVHNVDQFAEAVNDRLAQFRKSKDEEGTLLLRIRRDDGTALVFVPLPKE